MTKGLWPSRLNRAIRLAKECESTVLAVHQEKPQGTVAYGTLVFNRRLAEAVRQLRGDSDYEARIPLRCMLEIFYNYAWIRLRQSERRANRYLKFHCIERLKMMDDMSPEMKSQEYRAKYRALVNERSRYRHLFRFRDKKGKLRWATGWATKSLEARMMEVIAARTKVGEPLDRYMYSIYRWTSSSAHGGPSAMNEILRMTPAGLRPVEGMRGLLRDSSMTVGFSLLTATLELAHLDLRFAPSHEQRIMRLVQIVNEAAKGNTQS